MRKARRAFAHFRNAAVKAAFDDWRIFLLEAAEKRARVAASLTHWRQRAMADAFRTWRDTKQLSDRLRKASAFWRNGLLALSFVAWVAGAEEQRLSQDKLERAVRFFANARLAQAFNGWVAAAAEQAGRRSKVAVSLGRIMHRSTAKCLATWSLYARRERTVKRGLANRRRRLCQYGLRGFSATRRRGATVRRALLNLQNRTLAGAWAAWKDAWEDMRARRLDAEQRRELALRRLANGALLAAFNTWADFAHKSASARALLMRLTQKEKVAAFNAWRAHVTHSRGAAGILNRILNRQLAAAFNSWADWHGKAKRAALQLRRLRNRHALAAMRAWRDRAALGARVRTLMRGALDRSLASRWAQWRALMEELHDRQAEVAATAQMLSNNPPLQALLARAARRFAAPPGLLAGWAGWREYLEEARSEHAGTRLAAEHFFRSSSRWAFDEWCASVAEGRKARRAAAFWQGNAAQRAFLSWARYLEETRRRADALERAVRFWRSRAAAAALVRWAEFAADQSALKQKLRLSLVHRGTQLARKALQAWAVACVSQLDRREFLSFVFNSVDSFKLQRAFQGWATLASLMARLRRGVEGLKATCVSNLLRGALAAWAQQAKWQGGARSILAAAGSRLMHRALNASWATWVFWVERRRLADRALKHFGQRLLAAAFRSIEVNWREARATRAAVWGDKSVLRRYLARWVRFVPVSREKKDKFAKAAMSAFGSLLRRSFAAWARRAAVVRKAATLLGSNRFRQKGHLFAAWRDEATIGKAHRVLSATLLARSAHSVTAAVWRLWRTNARAQVHHLFAFRRKVLLGWRAVAAYYAAQTRKLRAALEAVGFGFLSRVFFAWRDMSQLLAERRERFFAKQAALRRALAVGDETLRRRKRLLLEDALLGWRLQLRKTREVNARFVRKLAGLKARGFNAWVEFTDRKANNRAKRDAAAAHFKRRMSRKPLVRWHELARLASGKLAAAIDRAFAHSFQRLGSRYLQRWKEYVQLQGKRRTKLQSAMFIVHSSDLLFTRAMYFRAWRRLVRERDRREADQEDAAAGHFRRRVLSDVFTVWAAYASAMRLPAMTSLPGLSAGAVPDALQVARRAEQTTWDDSPQKVARAEVLVRRLGLMGDGGNLGAYDDEDLERSGLTRDDVDYDRGTKRAGIRDVLRKMGGGARPGGAGGPPPGSAGSQAARARARLRL